MAQLTYANVNFGTLQRTLIVNDEAVQSADGIDFLYRKWTCEIVFIINPATMSGLTIATGSSAALTLQDVRQALETPRQLLTFSIGNKIIESPPRNTDGVRLSCDAAGGPFPEPLKVIEVQGDKSLICSYRVTTYLDDCAEDRVVLSNRWYITSDTDRLGYTTRTLEGECVVNLGLLLLQFNDNAIDRFRSNFMILPPDNFKRTAVRVTVTSDGSRAKYTCTDVEDPLNWKGFSNVEIEGNATAGWLVGVK